MVTTVPTVYVVDDDPQVCDSLSLMVRSIGLEARTYLSAEAFLDGCHDLPGSPKCLVLDVRMPGLGGLGLQKALTARGSRMPIIMISGCADIPIAVQAMSAGAMDFMEKPFGRRAILDRIQKALELDADSQRQFFHKTEMANRIDKLSPRQHEVLDLLVAGKHSKQIAGKLGIGEKTVAKHRAGVLEKMQAESIVDLVRQMIEAGFA